MIAASEFTPSAAGEHLNPGVQRTVKPGTKVSSCSLDRSPDDRFIVDEPSVHNLIDWGKVNVPISSEKADAIYVKMCAYMQNREVFYAFIFMLLSASIAFLNGFIS